MTRRRNLLLWFAFASIPLAALVIVLILALNPKPVPRQAHGQIKKIHLGMTKDQVRVALGTEASTSLSRSSWLSGSSETHSGSVWHFPDGSAIAVIFLLEDALQGRSISEIWDIVKRQQDGASQVTEFREVIRESPPRYAG